MHCPNILFRGMNSMAVRIFLVWAFLLAGITASLSGAGKGPDYDLMIKNGRIVDGSGRPAFRADIAIKGDRIERIGNLGAAQAKRIIDARGQVVSPGFI